MSIRRFSKIIEDLQLRDLPLLGGPFYLDWRLEQPYLIKARSVSSIRRMRMPF